MKEQNEKQAIEELTAFLWKNTLIHTEDLCHDVAETVIKEGYRKQSAWISVDERLPEESGEYLVLTLFGNQSVLSYSKVHKLFNAADSDNDAHHAKKYSIDVAYWMQLPEPPKGE